MKKSKIILVALLSVVLCLLCVFSTTFSWFTRPRSLLGDSLEWNSDNPCNVSKSGSDVTMVTYESTDDGKTFGDTPVTSFSNNSDIEGGKRKYYRTDITNSGSYAQSVSLYLSSLSFPTNFQGTFCLGVNGPLKTYKNYTPSSMRDQKISSSVKLKNVYVGFNVNQEYTPSDYKMHWWNDQGSEGDSDIEPFSKLNKSDVSYNNSNYNMTYSTIDWVATKGKMWHPSSNYWGYADDNTDINTYNTFYMYYWENNYHVDYVQSGKAAGLNTFYSSASVKVGNTISLAATGQGTITYSSSNSEVASVSTTGVVRGGRAGTATITATSTGIYGDTVKSTCEVTVYNSSQYLLSDVPIVTNLKVAAGSDTESGYTTESVYWYIKNDSNTRGMRYTISDIYLTL